MPPRDPRVGMSPELVRTGKLSDKPQYRRQGQQDRRP